MVLSMAALFVDIVAKHLLSRFFDCPLMVLFKFSVYLTTAKAKLLDRWWECRGAMPCCSIGVWNVVFNNAFVLLVRTWLKNVMTEKSFVNVKFNQVASSTQTALYVLE